MPSACLTNAELAYDDAGDGDKVLLLIHGHPFDRSMWRPQLPVATAAGWRVIAPDLRGYGESSSAAGKVTLETFARDIAELLDSLGCESALIGGLSMGGQIAMEFCRLFPERVTGLLLAATFARAETHDGKAERRRVADRLESEGLDGYAHELLPKMLAPESIERMPELAASVLAMMLQARAQGAAAALRGRAERPDYALSLPLVQAPALIVAGDRDSYTSRADAEELHNLLPNSELLWLTQVGHMPNLERRIVFNQALLALLERVEHGDRQSAG